MTAQTYTVVSGFTDRAGKHWVFVRGMGQPFIVSEPYPEGSSVRLEGGRAVRA